MIENMHLASQPPTHDEKADIKQWSSDIKAIKNAAGSTKISSIDFISSRMQEKYGELRKNQLLEWFQHYKHNMPRQSNPAIAAPVNTLKTENNISAIGRNLHIDAPPQTLSSRFHDIAHGASQQNFPMSSKMVHSQTQFSTPRYPESNDGSNHNNNQAQSLSIKNLQTVPPPPNKGFSRPTASHTLSNSNIGLAGNVEQNQLPIEKDYDLDAIPPENRISLEAVFEKANPCAVSAEGEVEGTGSSPRHNMTRGATCVAGKVVSYSSSNMQIDNNTSSVDLWKSNHLLNEDNCSRLATKAMAPDMTISSEAIRLMSYALQSHFSLIVESSIQNCNNRMNRVAFEGFKHISDSLESDIPTNNVLGLVWGLDVANQVHSETDIKNADFKAKCKELSESSALQSNMNTKVTSRKRAASSSPSPSMRGGEEKETLGSLSLGWTGLAVSRLLASPLRGGDGEGDGEGTCLSKRRKTNPDEGDANASSRIIEAANVSKSNTIVNPLSTGSHEEVKRNVEGGAVATLTRQDVIAAVTKHACTLRGGKHANSLYYFVEFLLNHGPDEICF